MRLRPPIDPELADPVAERRARSQDEAIRELQSLPFAGAVIVQNVELEDGVPTPIAHRLGKRPRWVGPSFVRGPSSTGRIEETRSGSHDRSQVVVLEANGWGATITIDVLVLP